MLDPKEQKKGGFGAFVQRDQERREAEAQKDAMPSGTAVPPRTTPANDATGSDASPAAPSTT